MNKAFLHGIFCSFLKGSFFTTQAAGIAFWMPAVCGRNKTAYKRRGEP
jgi:hypothetical protein